MGWICHKLFLHGDFVVGGNRHTEQVIALLIYSHSMRAMVLICKCVCIRRAASSRCRNERLPLQKRSMQISFAGFEAGAFVERRAERIL